MRAAVWVTTATTVAVCCSGVFSQEMAEPTEPGELIRVVRTAMEEYLSTGLRLCGTVREQSAGVGEETLWVDQKVQIKQNGQYGYLIEWRRDVDFPRPTWRVLLYGPAAGARLSKTTDGKWYVTHYRGGARAVRTACEILAYYTAPGYFVLAAPDWPLASLWWSDWVKVRSVEWTELDGRRVVKVGYSLDHSLYRRTGTAWLDPEWMWAIVRKEEFRPGETEPSVETVVYDEAFRPAPVPKSLEVRWKGRNGKDAWWRTAYEFRIPEKPPSDAEFTLAAFGIDRQVVGAEPRQRAPWLWLGIVACALAVVLWWIRHVLSRKAQAHDEQHG